MEKNTTHIETTASVIIKAAAKNGLLIGFFSVIITMVSYAIDPMLMAKWWLSVLFYLLSVGLVAYYVLDIRKKMGGYMNFIETALAVFITFVVTSFITQIFSYVLFTVIDPGLTDLLKEAVVNQTTEMMEKFNVPQEEMDAAIAKIEVEDYSMSVGKAAKGYLFGILFNLIVSMALGLFLRKNKPVFDRE